LALIQRLCLLIAALTAVLAPHRAAAETAPPVLIIVDGSGSMWGKMEGDQTAKLYGVRDLLRERLLTAPAQSRIGLGSFGHRRKGDCSDVEIITPIEAGGSEGAIAALEKLNPKGKGPLTTAVRQAAGAIGAGAAGHIVLLHDNADNCSQDVCAAATDIAKSNPALKIHVLSLGLARPERDRMQCLASTTKGLQFDATDQAGIATALTEIMTATGLDAAAAPAVAAAAPAATIPEAKGPPGLRISASLAEGGGPVDAALSWRIAKADATPETPPLVERKSREINETVDPGRYSVSVSYGLIQRTFDVEAGDDGPTVKRLNLSGGRLDVSATASRQGDQLTAPVMTISALSDGEKSPAGVLWVGREASAAHIVPAGTYAVEVADGLARSSQTVTVAAGTGTRADLVLDTGRLELTATAVDDGPPLDRVLYLVSTDDPAAPEGRREVARSTAPTAAFILQAGTYYITARHGAGELREQVAISSGDVVKKTLVLGVGNLTVKASLSEAAAQSGRATITRIFEAGDSKQLVGQSTAPTPVFTLGAGRYRVEIQIAMSNIRAQRVVELSAGSNVATELRLEAATVTIAGVTSTATQAAMRDASGKVVWRSRAGDGFKAIVAPGDYVLHVDGGGADLEKPVIVQPGPPMTVDIGQP
jgi:Ca-activated chloride channel family protein